MDVLRYGLEEKIRDNGGYTVGWRRVVSLLIALWRDKPIQQLCLVNVPLSEGGTTGEKGERGEKAARDQ